MSAVIEVTGLRKAFGRTQALDGLELHVAPGEVHGFLGPNGAGKTTTIRVLLGLIRADGGTARLLGADPWHEAVSLHRRLAYVPGDVTLWPNLSGGEVIDLLAGLRGGLDEKRKAVLLEKFELDPTKKSRAYSKGNRQKVALIAALSAGSELLILDEPTSGLDPLMEAAFRECVEEERRDGRTVLLSSHILSEVEALCDRVTIIRAGRTVDSGALADLRHLSRTSVRAELARPPAGLDQLPGLHDLDVEGTRVSCQADNSALDELLKRLTEAGVRSLVSQPPTLEELFLRHYTDAGHECRGAGRPAGSPGWLAAAGRYRGAGQAGAAPGPDLPGHLGVRAGRQPGQHRVQLPPLCSQRPASAPRWRTASRPTRRSWP